MSDPYPYLINACALLTRNVLMALDLAGEKPSAANVIRFLRSMREPDGYWSRCLQKAGQEQELLADFGEFMADVEPGAQDMLIAAVIGVLRGQRKFRLSKP
jgi:hypothetical protein